MSHPIDSVVTDNTRVPKPDFRQYIGNRTALVVNTAASIQTMSLGARGTTTVLLAGVSYFYDVADATSPHDGINVLVSADGRRYKVPVALPLMQGAQNVVLRKTFPAIYAGIGFRRFERLFCGPLDDFRNAVFVAELGHGLCEVGKEVDPSWRDVQTRFFDGLVGGFFRSLTHRFNYSVPDKNVCQLTVGGRGGIRDPGLLNEDFH